MSDRRVLDIDLNPIVDERHYRLDHLVRRYGQ